MIDHYDWPGGREAMLRFGPSDGPVVVVALPLFEEANRTRTFVVTLLRALAERGIASALPDLPGQGESLVPLHGASSRDMEEGYEGAVDRFRHEGRKVFSVAIRSGAVLDKLAEVDGRWHFAPLDGPGLRRELQRIRGASTIPRYSPELWHRQDTVLIDNIEAVEIAGNMIASDFLSLLQVDPPLDEDDGRLRIIRLDTDPKLADRHVPGAPLWRRAEPDNDPALANLIADDIAAWVRACEG